MHRRRVGIHDCSFRYQQQVGVCTVSAIIYGDVRAQAPTDTFDLPTTTQVELILDTGAALVGVKPSLFKLIQPREIRPYQLVGVSGQIQETQRGVVDLVVDGRLRANDVEIVAIGELPFPKISGLLGMSFLQHFGIYLDVKTSRPIQNDNLDIPILRFHYYNEANFEKD